MFSAPHLIWLFLMALLITVFAVRYCRRTENGRDNMRKRMALFLILFELFKQCVAGLTRAPAAGTLPLEICSFAEYTILADAFWPKNRILKQLMAFAFLPAAIMALSFPTVTAYPPVSFFAIHQFVLHAGIAAYIIARYAAGEILPRYFGLWTSVLMIGVPSVPIYLLNLIFGTNFMFLTNHSNNPVLKLLWNLS
ncbi:MAG: YwaF family protein [Lachnospiraceae bacterium]|nr:YwaF family protein [Lachnospiraceae bacterium]